MSSLAKYILNAAGEPVPSRNLLMWATWYETSLPARKVARTVLPDGNVVSTVFLGLDHRFTEEGPPILWETMVFDKDGEVLNTTRCAGNREQAEAMHAEMVAKLSAPATP